jgi:malonyl-CoA decarboxylase
VQHALPTALRFPAMTRQQSRQRNWLSRLWASIAERGRQFAPIPSIGTNPLRRAQSLASSLLSGRGEASGAALAQALLAAITQLSSAQRALFLNFLAEEFQADHKKLADAATEYLKTPSPATAARLAQAAEPPRQELLRRMNMAEGGTAALISLRKDIPFLLKEYPALSALDADLRHLLTSWFNPGFLELRQISWQSPASILEKLIAYEAVHEIKGWDDLRRRLASDRRCFAFFHPALPEEPLIFVEVALVKGLSASVRALLEHDQSDAVQPAKKDQADTAIFYSISNCQDGLRGISFGNFLIKQVVEILSAELPELKTFSTLSPVPGFRRWLENELGAAKLAGFRWDANEWKSLEAAHPGARADNAADSLGAALKIAGWEHDAKLAEALTPILLRLCALYLTDTQNRDKKSMDSVARFHLGNGARLERINWMANPEARGMRESWGIMVNYLYDPALIESHHEGFLRAGIVARSPQVNALTSGAVPSRKIKGSAV